MNKCQEQFELIFKRKETLATDNQLAISLDESEKQDQLKSFLGTVQFIGAMSNVRMLSIKIVHECIRKLLGDPVISLRKGFYFIGR